MKIFTDISHNDINIALKNVSLIYGNEYRPLIYFSEDPFYIRMYNDYLFYASMCHLDQRYQSLDMSGYEIYDYYDWLKENEVMIAAINFGLY